MNFKLFSVNSTNIFPISNSKAGGQLATEWNLRSRESVNTDMSVRYMIGPSYAHGEEDFRVDYFGEGRSTSITIAPGRAVVNGHFIESLTPMTVDLAAANAALKDKQQAPLTGKLAVGIRVFYSTLPTIAGSLLTEINDSGSYVYEGVQIVVLPEVEFKLPEDVPDAGQESSVTAHLKLATFNYINGSITSIVNNFPEKCQVMEAGRIKNVDSLLSKGYVKKTGLNPRRLYTFATKLNNPEDGVDTWCDSTDSLMIWDTASPEFSTTKPAYDMATFTLSEDSSGIDLVVPHKQVDGMMSPSGEREYYLPRVLHMPRADYSSDTPGTVSPAYTKRIKEVAASIRNQKYLPWRKQRDFLDTLNDLADLPPISPSWEVGDYVLVRRDLYVGTSSSTSQAPSTMYVVLPGLVKTYQYVTSATDETVPSELAKGTCLLSVAVASPIDPSDEETWPTFFSVQDQLRGTSGPGNEDNCPDYFVAVYSNASEDVITRYYFAVTTTGPNEYSPSILVTGEIPLAQEDLLGGFYNISENSLDQGYVIRDENGHLKLLDYAILRSGTLAYQLGKDFSVPSGITTLTVQDYLDEYVNNRIAFVDRTSYDNPYSNNVINVTITLPEETDPYTLNICNIDSRFGASVNLHILGSANSNTVINITDCERIRIDNNISGDPKINLFRSSLYYDPAILNRLNIISDLGLWYEKYSENDPDLCVTGMTVSELHTPIVAQSSDFWSPAVRNDYHFMYALQSLTFGNDGSVIGIGLYIKNDTTANVQEGHSILTREFVLPQGSGLVYPQVRMTNRLKVSGSFVTAYKIVEPSGYMTIDTDFTAVCNPYDEYSQAKEVKGTIAFHSNAAPVYNLIEEADPGLDIYGWVSGSYHIFYGGVVQ